MGYRTTNLLCHYLAHTRSVRAVKIAHVMGARVWDDDDPKRPNDSPPRRYFGGFRDLAEAIGRDYHDRPETADQLATNHRTHSAISTAIRQLTADGIIRRIHPAINGQPAEYEVLPNITALQADMLRGNTNF